MRFLSENFLGSYNNQDVISSSSGEAFIAFSDTTKFLYVSDGQDTDGDTVELGQDFSEEQTLDTIVVLLNNFADFKISTATTSGGAFSDITGTATLTTSQDGLHRLYKFASPISFFDIKFEIDDTVVADEEKEVGAILGMLELGTLERFKLVKPKGVIQRKIIKLESGGVAVLNKGSQHWEFSINVDLLSGQTDMDLIEAIEQRQLDFFFWINDNFDGQETVKQEPYRFEDWIRCGFTGDSQPQFYKNYLNKAASGNKLKFAQTGKIDKFDPSL